MDSATGLLGSAVDLNDGDFCLPSSNLPLWSAPLSELGLGCLLGDVVTGSPLFEAEGEELLSAPCTEFNGIAFAPSTSELDGAQSMFSRNLLSCGVLFGASEQISICLSIHMWNTIHLHAHCRCTVLMHHLQCVHMECRFINKHFILMYLKILFANIIHWLNSLACTVEA